MTQSQRWPTVVDLFSGCGAVTEGLKKRHFRVIAAVDNDSVACRTYRKNHPTVHLFENDIAKISPYIIRKNLLHNLNLDLLVVCAPCQPFSSQGKKHRSDKRTNLILNSVRFAKILFPKLILFENVPGLASTRFENVLEELKNIREANEARRKAEEYL